MKEPQVKNRSINLIAQDILAHWPNPAFSAKPYLRAMLQLTSINDSYGNDDARSIVRYFLSNATTWRGEKARQIKAELNILLKK